MKTRGQLWIHYWEHEIMKREFKLITSFSRGRDKTHLALISIVHLNTKHSTIFWRQEKWETRKTETSVCWYQTQ